MMAKEKMLLNFGKGWTCRAVAHRIKGIILPLRNSRGFSLIELIVVCAILAVLCAIAIPAYPKFKDAARESGAMTEVRTIELAINSYVAETGSLPADLSVIKYDSLKDPWGNRFHYAIPSGTPAKMTLHYISSDDGINTDYDLWCTGQDESRSPTGTTIINNDNIIIRANNGAYVGLAKNYLNPF